MSRVDVEAVVAALGIETKRRGKYHWASCPRRDHRDSDASWRIDLDETSDRYGQHRCYGCRFGGYAVHLVAEVMACSLKDAREWLNTYESAERLPLEIEIVQQDDMATREFRMPLGVVTTDERPYEKWPTIIRRFVERRGVTPAQVTRWGIGYAVEGYLRGRVVIPVRNARGELISYTGRSFTGAELRYRNATDKQGADMSAVFGEQRWDEAPDRCILVEGALNGLACERVAPGWSIGAIFGSHVTSGHVTKFSRFRRVVLASDADKAGDSVADAVAEALMRYAHVTRLPLPRDVDCNDMEPAELRKLFDAEEAARA